VSARTVDDVLKELGIERDEEDGCLILPQHRDTIIKKLAERIAALDADTARLTRAIEAALNEHEATRALTLRIEELNKQIATLDAERAGVAHFVIPAQVGLDPVRVIFIDHEPGKGTLIVQCYNEAWTTYFGGMGKDSTLVQFIARVDRNYLGNALHRGNAKYLERIANAVILACRERLTPTTPEASDEGL
jgi:hypothetical protein